MKISVILIMFMVFIITSMFAQWDIEEGFESGTFPPTGWSVINNGAGETWGGHSSAGYSHTGSYYAYLSDGFSQADDWLITPQVSVQNGDKMTFWARMSYITENFNVKLSTTGNSASDFTVTLGSETITSNTYIEYEYDLSSYIGNVYLAIQGVTSTSYQLFVDDVKVGQDAPSIIYIPVDYPTIQAGLNAANVGTTVLVSAGTYYENIEWPDTDEIVLISDNGAANTIIDGNELDRVIYIPQACDLTNATVIDGFTIQNGNNSDSRGPGGGIADYCGITIKNNVIQNNFAGGVGGGLHLVMGNPLVFNNLITNNTSNDAGGGIYLFCGAEIRNNTIVGNTATGAGGGGIAIMFAGGTKIIEDNIIVNNSADGTTEGGGGILVSFSSCSLDYNDVWGNTPNNYAGCSAGSNSISADPVFVSSNNGSNFINQATSPCLNAGSQTAIAAGLNDYTTSFEAVLDIGQVDMGFHYNPNYFVYPPAVPENVLLVINGDNVELSWDLAINATDYKVEYSTDPYSGYSELASTTSGATSYVHTNGAVGTNYFYRVIALD
ncbi:MAG: choice-of-anchor J domain-containing protein [Candidatus Cloacimonetes bacterium]|nr:choice-of-anchor J domain-containing protein [Candidatus Cloacimonadota bacterium]